MKKLNEIISCDFDTLISGISDDSRDIREGYLFVATKGFNVDHFDYIDKAILNGAVAIVCDREVDVSVPCVLVDNINALYPELCRKFYGVDTSSLSLIGITGTDGKTTSATIVQKLLNDDNSKCAYIGTNGLLVDGKTYHISNTTPCISELYSSLSIVQEHKCKSLAMEVSSEALLHNRVQGLKYSIVAITNITEDHLNVHKTLKNYRACKFKIVDHLKENGVAIVNGDDENCQKLHVKNLIKFGFNDDNDYVIFDFVEDKKGVKFKIRYEEDVYEVSSQLFGKYNAYNITLAFIIGLLNNIDASLLLSRIKDISFITGRGERLVFGQDYTIILDYAHTYNAILNLINSVKGKYKRIITVTGAAGGREKEKRSKIGKMILEKSDLVIFTMDDPRTESVDSIIDDMIGECKNTNYERINDRVEAIYHAFEIAKPNEAVLVIGKGRDDYMAVGTEKLPYCDYDVIKKYFEK